MTKDESVWNGVESVDVETGIGKVARTLWTVIMQGDRWKWMEGLKVSRLHASGESTGMKVVKD